MKFDCIIKNGLAIDFSDLSQSTKDLYIKDGLIVDCPRGESPDSGLVVDASGKYVLPGLVDEHAHINYLGSNLGCNADLVCIPNGITTVLDAGSTGFANFRQFYSFNAVRAVPNVFAYLHASPFGVISGVGEREENHNPADFSEYEIRKTFDQYPDCLRGIKVRLCRGTIGENGTASPLARALEIAEKVKSDGHACVVAVHYGDLPPTATVRQIVELLRPNDIFTHVFQPRGETILDRSGRVQDCVRRAQNRGVVMDSANGRIHYSFEIMEQAFRDNFFPDIISSDVVRDSAYSRPGFSLLYAMCVHAAAGMRINEIFKAVTYTPAKVLGITDKAGTLETGKAADITIFDLAKCDQIFYDVCGSKRCPGIAFVPLLTMKDGKVAYRQIDF